uniref:Reverse transcriptase domain-containing protein n=1 Tax=Macrostomum lignano TaxID=282301 RepID=A0A1I8G123_9PLAT
MHRPTTFVNSRLRRGEPRGGGSAGGCGAHHRPEQEWQNPVVADDRAGPNGPAANGRGGSGGRRRGRNRQQQQYAEEFEHEYQVERHIEPLPTATGAFSVTIRNDRCRNADPDRGGGGGGRRRKSRRNRRAGGGRGGGDVGDVGAMPGEVEGATPAVPEDGGFIDDDLDGVGAGVGGDAGGGGGSGGGGGRCCRCFELKFLSNAIGVQRNLYNWNLSPTLLCWLLSPSASARPSLRIQLSISRSSASESGRLPGFETGSAAAGLGGGGGGGSSSDRSIRFTPTVAALSGSCSCCLVARESTVPRGGGREFSNRSKRRNAEFNSSLTRGRRVGKLNAFAAQFFDHPVHLSQLRPVAEGVRPEHQQLQHLSDLVMLRRWRVLGPNEPDQLIQKVTLASELRVKPGPAGLWKKAALQGTLQSLGANKGRVRGASVGQQAVDETPSSGLAAPHLLHRLRAVGLGADDVACQSPLESPKSQQFTWTGQAGAAIECRVSDPRSSLILKAARSRPACAALTCCSSESVSVQVSALYNRTVSTTAWNSAALWRAKGSPSEPAATPQIFADVRYQTAEVDELLTARKLRYLPASASAENCGLDVARHAEHNGLLRADARCSANQLVQLALGALYGRGQQGEVIGVAKHAEPFLRRTGTALECPLEHPGGCLEGVRQAVRRHHSCSRSTVQRHYGGDQLFWYMIRTEHMSNWRVRASSMIRRRARICATVPRWGRNPFCSGRSARLLWNGDDVRHGPLGGCHFTGEHAVHHTGDLTGHTVDAQRLDGHLVRTQRLAARRLLGEPYDFSHGDWCNVKTVSDGNGVSGGSVRMLGSGGGGALTMAAKNSRSSFLRSSAIFPRLLNRGVVLPDRLPTLGRSHQLDRLFRGGSYCGAHIRVLGTSTLAAERSDEGASKAAVRSGVFESAVVAPRWPLQRTLEVADEKPIIGPQGQRRDGAAVDSAAALTGAQKQRVGGGWRVVNTEGGSQKSSVSGVELPRSCGPPIRQRGHCRTDSPHSALRRAMSSMMLGMMLRPPRSLQRGSNAACPFVQQHWFSGRRRYGQHHCLFGADYYIYESVCIVGLTLS